MNKAYLLLLSLFILSCGNDQKVKSGKSSVFTDDKYQEVKDDSEGSNANAEKNNEPSLSEIPSDKSIYEVKQEELEAKIDELRNSREQQRLRVSGRILNGGGKTLTLDRLGVESGFEPLSTTVINDDGVFELNTTSNQEAIYQLRTQDKGNMVLFVGPGNYEVNADYNNLQEYTVSNSPESKKLLDFYLMIESYNTKIEKLDERKDKLTDYEALKSLLDSMPIYHEKIREDKTKDIKAFVNANRNSLLATIACDRIDFLRNTRFALDVFEEQYEKYPYSTYVKNMGKKLIRYKPTAIGEVAKELVMPDLNGKNHRLSDMKGKYVLLYFMIGYSTECQAYNKELIQIYNRFKPKGFEIYGVTLDMTESEWRNTISEQNINFLTVGDMLGEKSYAFKHYLAMELPMTYLIDPDGIIVDKFLTTEKLTQTLQEKLF